MQSIRELDAAFVEAREMVDRDSRPLARSSGARTAFAAIINCWQSHRGPTNWVHHFDNIGHWGTAYLDRAALTEYVQVGNDRTLTTRTRSSTRPGSRSLDGGSFGYAITFAKDQLPECQRFWSLTAYTPEYIELDFSLLFRVYGPEGSALDLGPACHRDPGFDDERRAPPALLLAGRVSRERVEGAAARRLTRIEMRHTAAAGGITCGCREVCQAA